MTLQTERTWKLSCIFPTDVSLPKCSGRRHQYMITSGTPLCLHIACRVCLCVGGLLKRKQSFFLALVSWLSAFVRSMKGIIFALWRVLVVCVPRNKISEVTRLFDSSLGVRIASLVCIRAIRFSLGNHRQLILDATNTNRR